MLVVIIDWLFVFSQVLLKLVTCSSPTMWSI